jgi:hypothetical protein
MSELTTVQLKFAKYVDFRKCEYTHWKENAARTALLKASECALFISNNGQLLRFVWKPRTLANLAFEGSQDTVVSSRLFRITRKDGDSPGHWSPYMLQNYAESEGLKLEGYKTFAEHFNRMQELKKKPRE